MFLFYVGGGLMYCCLCKSVPLPDLLTIRVLEHEVGPGPVHLVHEDPRHAHVRPLHQPIHVIRPGAWQLKAAGVHLVKTRTRA